MPVRIFVSDDRYSPQHLDRPWLPVQLHPTAGRSTGSTSRAHAQVEPGPGCSGDEADGKPGYESAAEPGRQHGFRVINDQESFRD